ncbi:MAG: hypothetical protein II328_04385, partial [Clostridia bacterium]|nr:hypothetical protein [Clostridia bacterium]
GEEIKRYVNETLLPALYSTEAENSAAHSIGSGAVGDIPAGTLHSQLLTLKEQKDALEKLLHDAAAGQFVPDSIPITLLEAELRNTVLSAFGRNANLAAFTTPGTHEFRVPRTGLYRLRMCGAGGGGSFFHPLIAIGGGPDTGETYACRGGAAGAGVEAYLSLTENEVCTIHIGAGGEVNEVEENTLAVSKEGYDILDLQAYHEDEDWISRGENSTFTLSDGGLLFTCFGADPTKHAVHTTVHSREHVQHVFPHSGYNVRFLPGMPYEEINPQNFGMPSLFGGGGEYIADGESVAPSYGAGGQGGVLYLRGPLFDEVAAPTKGGDGAAFLEYVA